MSVSQHQSLKSVSKRFFYSFLILCFVGSSWTATPALAQEIDLNLPPPSRIKPFSKPFNPATIRAITINPNDPFLFDFIIDRGDTDLSDEAFEAETEKLVKYFLAALTIPESDLWVNLSPYEQDAMVSPLLGVTDMGKDLLIKDYYLKQVTAGMTHPNTETGKKFWDLAYKRARELYGDTKVPINTFSKVWIVPDQAVVLEKDGSAFIADSYLKVFLDQDYLAVRENLNNKEIGTDRLGNDKTQDINQFSAGIIKEVILPEIEKEVNTGENFATIRQIYTSAILATWYKTRLKESLLGQLYADQGKVAGVDFDDPSVGERIFEKYTAALKSGAYNMIRQDYDLSTQKIVQRKYFSGGANFRGLSGSVTALPAASVTSQGGVGSSVLTQRAQTAVSTAVQQITAQATSGGASLGVATGSAAPRLTAVSIRVVGSSPANTARSTATPGVVNLQPPGTLTEAQTNVFVVASLRNPSTLANAVQENTMPQGINSADVARVMSDSLNRISPNTLVNNRSAVIQQVATDVSRYLAAPVINNTTLNPTERQAQIDQRNQDALRIVTAVIQPNANSRGAVAVQQRERIEVIDQTVAAMMLAPAPDLRQAAIRSGLSGREADLLVSGVEKYRVAQASGQTEREPATPLVIARMAVSSNNSRQFANVIGVMSDSTFQSQMAQYRPADSDEGWRLRLALATAPENEAVRAIEVSGRALLRDSADAAQEIERMTNQFLEARRNNPGAFRSNAELSAVAPDLAGVIREVNQPELSAFSQRFSPNATQTVVATEIADMMISSLPRSEQSRYTVAGVADQLVRAGRAGLLNEDLNRSQRNSLQRDFPQLTQLRENANLRDFFRPGSALGAIASTAAVAQERTTERVTPIQNILASVRVADAQSVVQIPEDDPILAHFTEISRRNRNADAPRSFDPSKQAQNIRAIAYHASIDPDFSEQIRAVRTASELMGVVEQAANQNPGFSEMIDRPQLALLTNRDLQSVGGIDLSAERMDLKIKRDGQGVPLPVSQQDLENLRIEGLAPVILDIRPATPTSVPFLMNLANAPSS